MRIFKKRIQGFSKKADSKELPEFPRENTTTPSLPEADESKEQLLSNLLDKITPVETEWGNTAFENESTDIHSADLAHYPEISVPTNLEKKIHQLEKVVRSIEKRKISPPKYNEGDFSKFKVNYAHVLNQTQLAAVMTVDKPVLVIAGAGSGKTRIIVHRVSYLMEKGIDPRAILLLTFTRKASVEMLERVQGLLQNKHAGRVTGGTFHSFASNVLRKYANLLGIHPHFTIIDTADSMDIVDLIRTELKLNTSKKRFPRKNRIYEIISYARNRNTTLSHIIKTEYSGLEDYIKDIELIRSGYSQYKKRSNLLDFDDLMDVLNHSLKTNTKFREILQNVYQYVMVDEYQDTNIIQKEIVQILAGKHRRIMVVGDDSQSIYAFRGANYENILRFPEAFPECILVKIEENYRSTQTLLDFTNAIMDHAKIGFRKKLFSQNKKEHFPMVKRLSAQTDEAEFIADRILELREQGVPLNQIAVLNRADWHNRYIQTELNARGIPYVVVGGFRFNERLHIKDILAYLKLTYNPSDAVSWHRVLKYIGGVGQITAGKVISEIQIAESKFSFDYLKQKKFYNALTDLGSMLAKASRPEYSITQKAEIIKDYYAPLLKAREDDYANRMLDVEILIDLSKKYTNLDRFLSDFALDPPSKRVADQTTPLIDEGEEKNKLTISTVHSAKGLEWYAVFIPHALEGMFPSNRAADMEEMEEERRLFYVACSRAKEELYITFPRYIYSYDAFFNLPSRFLVEMDKEKFTYGEA